MSAFFAYLASIFSSADDDCIVWGNEAGAGDTVVWGNTVIWGS